MTLRAAEASTLPDTLGALEAEARESGELDVADRAVLVQMSGAEAGRVHRVTEALTLGRSDECSIRFDDATLSRVHARISPEGDGYVLADEGSRNGCFVNGKREKRARLLDGDRVRLASGALLRFHMVSKHEETTLVGTYEGSVRDGLTGVYNRRYFDERVAAEIAYAGRHDGALSVAFFDLDRFKQINDKHGHLTGDAVLRHVAVLITSLTRADDVVARYGGEELVVLGRGVSGEQAVIIAERIRLAVAGASIRWDDVVLRVTLSAGVASLASAREPTAAAFLGLADERLYAAKAAGRNRVFAG